MSFAPVSTLMPGIIPAARMAFNKGRAILQLLADRLVVKDRPADALTQTGRGDNNLPVSAPGLFGLGIPARQSV